MFAHAEHTAALVTQDSLCQDSHALGLPGYGKKAELATALMEAAKEAGRQGNAKEQKQAKVYQVSEEPGQVLEVGHH